MYGPASCGSTGGPWCNYVWRNNNYVSPVVVPVKPVATVPAMDRYNL